MKKLLLLALLGVFAAPDMANAQAGMAEPPCVVYKTKKNYDRNVAVELSEDRTHIVSYPHPRDVYTGGTLCTPVRLARNFRLDRRGIGPHVAFLSVTYEEYSQWQEPPSVEKLESLIIDRKPLKKMYRCPNPNPEHPEEALNTAIRKGKKGFEDLLK